MGEKCNYPKLLFKAKLQVASRNDHGGNEWHNMEVDGQMYSREVKIVDLIREYLRRKEKTKMREGW
jgi:hypothetical protein